jgi:hypothetical protein
MFLSFKKGFDVDVYIVLYLQESHMVSFFKLMT